jgi:hypothetical protein
MADSAVLVAQDIEEDLTCSELEERIIYYIGVEISFGTDRHTAAAFRRLDKINLSVIRLTD